MLKNGKRVNALYLAVPRQYSKKFIYRKATHAQNKNHRAVPLDFVPERSTKRCSLRIRPGDRFCELQIPVSGQGRREMSGP